MALIQRSAIVALSVCGALASVAQAQPDVGAGVAPAYNRSVHAADITYARHPAPTPGAECMITGRVLYATDGAADRDLACVVTVYVNSIPVGGGPGQGGVLGECPVLGTGTTQRVKVGHGFPIGGEPGITYFNCELFCADCIGFDVNVCVPPTVGLPNDPNCICVQACQTYRTTGFAVPVAELNPNDVIEIDLTVLPGAEPELELGDDVASTTVAAATVCLADWNQDGGLNDQDFFDWVNDYFTGEGPVGSADFNADGFENDQDWFDFTNAYFNPEPACD